MSMSGAEAILTLKEGNERFLAAERGDDDPFTFTDLSSGQAPFAAVVACSDSRVPVETIFNQGAGQLFVIREAGNLAGPHAMASLEFAAEALNVPLILVLGHSSCGAVKAALASVASDEPSALPPHLDKMVQELVVHLGLRSDEGSTTPVPPVPEAVERSVNLTCQQIVATSEAIAAKVRTGKLMLRGGVYDLETGRVSIL
jgi:carbonic anhydrase